MIRKRKIFLLLVLLPLFLLASCGREMVAPEPPAGGGEQTFTPLHFRATATDGSGTKASVSYGQYIFKEGDRLFVSYDDGEGVKMYGFLTLVFGFDNSTGVFEGDLLCVDGFTPEASTPLDAILVSANDQIHSWANGQVMGTSWPSNEFASSFEDAVERFSDFRASATYGNPVFSLNQNSSFLIFEVSFEDEIAKDVALHLVIKNGESTIREGTVTTSEVNNTVQANFVAVFQGGATSLSRASFELTNGGNTVFSDNISNSALAKNTYYTVSRSTVNLDFFTIMASEVNTEITFNYNTNVLKYRKKGEANFSDYSGPIELTNAGDYVQLISTGTNYNNSSGTLPLFSSADNKLCYIYGDLMSLMCEGISETGYTSKKTDVGRNEAFKQAFLNASYIDIPSGRPLKLSATTLKDNCYQEMFKGCTALSRPPVLSATSVPKDAYRNMFNGCTALTEAPDLPTITSIGNSGCLGMFYGCTAMRSAPTRIATPDATLAISACHWMFYNCSSLINAPQLPATSVPQSGYYEMFKGCTSLTAAPQLPATTVGQSSYEGMFYGCTAMLTAPSSLPALTVGVNSYKQMFSGCTALTTTPEDLPATMGANECYNGMFNGCISISEPPATISLSSIGSYGCYQMFYGCTSLISAPNMNSVISVGNYACQEMFKGCGELRELRKLNEGEPNEEIFSLKADEAPLQAYYQMFYGCAKLTAAPSISATTVGNKACQEMFKGCTRLTTPPSALGAATVSDNAYNGMFYGCSSLTSAPTLPNVTSVGASGCYRMFYECSRLASFTGLSNCTTVGNNGLQEMFYNCQVLTSGPSLSGVTSVGTNGCYRMFKECIRLQAFTGLSACTTVGNNGFQEMFYDCQMVNSAINLTNLTNLGSSSCYNMFYNCKRLASATTSLPATNLAASCYRGMYYGCISLTSAPTTLPATTLTGNCYFEMFRGCTALESAPSLPATTLATSCYQGMFYGCTALESIPETLPATTLAASCYRGMFYGCTTLESAPVLPALELVSNCYYEMFRNCSNLLSVTCLATSGINTDGSTSNWLNGVPNTVALHGTFNYSPDASVSGDSTGSGIIWPRSVHGIPTNWIISNGLVPIFPGDPFDDEEDF